MVEGTGRHPELAGCDLVLGEQVVSGPKQFGELGVRDGAGDDDLGHDGRSIEPGGRRRRSTLGPCNDFGLRRLAPSKAPSP